MGDFLTKCALIGLDDNDSEVKISSIQTLGIIGGPSIALALRGMLNDKEPMVVVAACHEIEDLHDLGSSQRLETLAESSTDSIRVAAKRALATLRGAQE